MNNKTVTKVTTATNVKAQQESPEIVVQEQQAVSTTNESTCSTVMAQQTISVNLDSELSDLNVMAQQASVTKPVQ